MLIRWAELYENTDILSPIDLETWEVIAKSSMLGRESRVVELASGKGAFALHIAKRFGSRVDCYDSNAEFVQYSRDRAKELGLVPRVRFTLHDVNSLRIKPDSYNLGVCLGALYIFREAGWKLLMKAVKPGGYLAISDLFCKKPSAPKAVMDVFFEEEDQPFTLGDVRNWYTSRGAKILREEDCSRKAWLAYYTLTKKMILRLARRYRSDGARKLEIEKELREDRLVRRFGGNYLGYMTFIMQKP